MPSRGKVAILGAALMGVAATSGPVLTDLPPTLAAYRGWVQLLKEPQPVPMELWIRCARVSQADWAEARRKHGPHTERYIRVYGNPQATRGLLQPRGSSLPYGSIIAKEKLPASPDAQADGVGFMIRHAPPAFAATSGWEFVYRPSSGNERQTHEACAACHRSVPGYVFGQYPVKQAKEPLR